MTSTAMRTEYLLNSSVDGNDEGEADDSSSDDKDVHNRPTRKRSFSTMANDSNMHHAQSKSPILHPKTASRHKEDTLFVAQDNCHTSTDQALCIDCLGLNLSSLLPWLNRADTTDSIEPPSPWSFKNELWAPCLVAKVGRRYRSAGLSTCRLCKALVDSRLDNRKPGRKTRNENKNEEIRAVPLQRHARLSMQTLYSRGWQGGAGLVLVPEGLPYDFETDVKHGSHIRSRGCVVLLEDAMDPKQFTPQPVPRHFDHSTAKSWLSYCTKNHKLLCASKRLPVRGVKVIDCMTLRIEDCSPTTSYVALSYVWGSAQNIHGVSGDRGTQLRAQDLPLVIQDSLEVTKALGYRFLWVDKYCIDQNAPDLKHDQIQQMDAIYHNSELTLISAAGADENYGLPGVGTRARLQQTIVELPQGRLIQIPPDPHESIALSHWSTRGWTFQEAVLSRRRLVFTDDQVYFQCCTMNCFESFHLLLDELHIKNRSKSLEHVRAGIFGRNRSTQYGKVVQDKLSLNNAFGSYLSNVEEYTARNLRFDEDSLNALSGVLRNLSRQKFRFNDIWGLCYPQMASEQEKCLIHSLTWSHKTDSKKPRRRVAFPSWTWAGWEGPVAYNFSSGTQHVFNSKVQQIRFKDRDGGWVEVKDLAQESRCPVLQLTAPSIPLAADALQLTTDTVWLWVMHKWRAKLSWSADSETYASFLESYTCQQRWQFIYIGRRFLMVLESIPKSQTWQRVGSCHLEHGYSAIFYKYLEKCGVRTVDIV